MKRLVILLLSLMVFSCQNQHEEIPFIKIEQFGSYNSLVFNGDQNEQITLSEYAKLKNFYALGVLEDVGGDLTIINSKVFNSDMSNQLEDPVSPFDQKASFFVSSVVELWDTVSIKQTFRDLDSIEDFILKSAEERDIDSDRPFPFVLHGVVKKLDWYSWESRPSEEESALGESELNREGIEKIQGEVVQVLGFFDKDNSREIGKGDDQTNMNFTARNGQLSGHVDDLIIDDKMILKLPKRNY